MQWHAGRAVAISDDHSEHEARRATHRQRPAHARSVDRNESAAARATALWASAAASLAGTRVRWPVASWGGEATTATFEAPDGWRGTERTRFVSRGLTNLGEVDAAGSIVIVCPHIIDGGAAEIVLEGTVLGVVDRGGPELWLGDCVVSR